MRLYPIINRAAGGWEDFLSAVAFLSRLAPSRDANFGSALAWFGVAGLCVGAVASLGAWLAHAAAIGIGRAAGPVAALIGGLAWISLEIWLTRGLHWDGCADLADALGSGARGERFWQIMKDSRLGAFGALALILGTLAQLLFVAARFCDPPANPAPALALLSLACAWGRLAPLWLAARARPRPGGGLGRLVCENLSPRLRLASYINALCVLGAALLLGAGTVGVALIAAGQIALIAWLARVARRVGGLSGDFFGAAVEGSQGLFLCLAAIPC